MPGLMSKLQAKLEIFRLEQRYTRNRHRRSTFVSNAVYVDGEYIYQTPNTTGSSSKSNSTNASSMVRPIEEEDETTTQKQQKSRRRRNSVSAEESRDDVTEEEPTPAQRKRLHRYSSMPGFGSSYNPKTGTSQTWAPSTVAVREVR